MEWVPIGLVAFKAIVFGTGMFFAIKWHYDKERAEKQKKEEERLRASGLQAPPAQPLNSAEKPADPA